MLLRFVAPFKNCLSDNNSSRRFIFSILWIRQVKIFILEELWLINDLNSLFQSYLLQMWKKIKEMEEIIGYNNREIMKIKNQFVFTQLQEQCSVKEIEKMKNSIEKLIEVKKKGSNHYSIFMLDQNR